MTLNFQLSKCEALWALTSPPPPDNLFFRSFALLFKQQSIELPAVRIRMTINIPPGCGLGSSATAVVGGLLAANDLLRLHDMSVSNNELLALAVEAEAGKHPDNVAPALLGGLVATTNVDGKIHAIKTRVPGCDQGRHFYAFLSHGYRGGQEVITC